MSSCHAPHTVFPSDNNSPAQLHTQRHEKDTERVFANMADDVLFEFLHMEIVSHVYKEQASRDDCDKVSQFLHL